MLPLLVGFALLFGNIFAADKKSDKEQDGLKGPVGSVRVEKATITKENNQVVEGERRRSHKIRYSETGEMIEMIAYTGDYISRLLFFTGDGQGNTLASIFERGNPLAPPPTPADSSTPQLTNSKKVFKHVFKYDNKGNRTEDVVYAEDGTLFSKDVYLFDVDGKPYGVRSFDEKGPTSSSRFTYNSNGMMITQSFTNQTGKITENRTYAYDLDAHGNWVRQTALRILDTGKIEPIEVIYRTLSYYPPVGNFSGLGVIGGISKEGAEKNENTNVTRMTGAVLAGSAIRRVEPVYPALAKAARIQGAVVVEVTVDEEGDVLTARTLQGHPLLKDGAEKAALGWKFTPTSLNGMPVRVVGTLTFNFNL